MVSKIRSRTNQTADEVHPKKRTSILKESIQYTKRVDTKAELSNVLCH